MEFYRNIPGERIEEPGMMLPASPFDVLPRVLFEAQQLLADRPAQELEPIWRETFGLIDHSTNPDQEIFFADQIASRGWAIQYLNCPQGMPDTELRPALRKFINSPLPKDLPEEQRQILLRLRAPNLVAQMAEGMDVLDWRCGGCFVDVANLMPKASEYFAILAWQMVLNSHYESDDDGGVKEWHDYMREKHADERNANRLFHERWEMRMAMADAADYAMIAIEALAFARLCVQVEQVVPRDEMVIADLRQPDFLVRLVDQAQRRRSGRHGSKGGRTRSAYYERIRQDVLDAYYATIDRYPSIEKAAAALAREKPAAHRTIVDWIRADRKARKLDAG